MAQLRLHNTKCCGRDIQSVHGARREQWIENLIDRYYFFNFYRNMVEIKYQPYVNASLCNAL